MRPTSTKLPKAYAQRTTPDLLEAKSGHFDFESHPDLFEQYLQIKQEVFAEEMGFDLMTEETLGTTSNFSRLAPIDKWDRSSWFYGITDNLGKLLAVARATSMNLGESYPYSHLFEPIFSTNPSLIQYQHTMLTSVACLQKFRGHKVLLDNLPQPLSLGRALMLSIAEDLANTSKAEVIWLTTMVDGAMGFFLKFDGEIIGEPFFARGAHVVNMKLRPHLILDRIIS